MLRRLMERLRGFIKPNCSQSGSGCGDPQIRTKSLKNFDFVRNLMQNKKIMSNLVNRDQKRRKLYKKFESKRVLFKSIIQDLSLPKQFRLETMIKTSSLPRNSSKSRIRNRCIDTGRGKAIYSKFKLSRISFRELATKGLLPGVLKASW